MPYFIIHGPANCPNFCHAIFVAQYLAEHLPNFAYKKVEIAPTGWGEHLMKVNSDNKWCVIQSPLIWKEVLHWGGKRYLIGGLGDFWEYVYSYYGLESRIPKADLLKLAEENLRIFEEKLREAEERHKYVRNISIVGGSNLITTLLINDLLVVPNLGKRDGMLIKLFDERSVNKRKYKIMEDTANYYNSQHPCRGEKAVVIVTTAEEVLDDCDLLIIVDDLKVYPDDTEHTTLEKWYARMNYLSEAATRGKHRNMKIVVANQGPGCFIATCLVDFCTTVRPSNIVVVSADLGLSYVNALSDKTGIPVCRISGPPVWGFTGLAWFVDETQTVYKGDVYRPNKRSLTATRGSTLPLGTIKSELRLMSYLITDHDEIVRMVEERKKKMIKRNDRPPVFGKIRSIISLLKLWYAETPSDEIISLGVCSDGSFDIPPGVVFSQPVMLNEKNRWVPCADFPLMNDTTEAKIRESIEATSTILKDFGLLRHICKSDEDICSNPECPVTKEYERYLMQLEQEAVEGFDSLEQPNQSDQYDQLDQYSQFVEFPQFQIDQPAKEDLPDQPLQLGDIDLFEQF